MDVTHVAMQLAAIELAGIASEQANTQNINKTKHNDPEVAAKLQEERRARKAANFAKRQPKHN